MTSAAVGGAEWCGAEWCLLAAAALALLASGAAAALRLSEASKVSEGLTSVTLDVS